MKIGIIIFSQTGHTLTVAQTLRDRLTADGHSTAVEQIAVSGEGAPGKFKLRASPAVEAYDALVFGAPVQAFSLKPVMAAYLKELPSLEGKKIVCFVTKHLAFRWTGGHQALSKMKRFCRSKGAPVAGAEIVIWSGAAREQAIQQCVENLGNLFQESGKGVR
jgi:NAD(P)H dehydrogenase (quinone)